MIQLIKDIPTFEAKCTDCGKSFVHPSVGDFAYGEAVLTGRNSNLYAWISAFDEFPKKVNTLISKLGANNPGILWKVLALLADPVEGQTLSEKLFCQNCGSDNLAFWCGTKIGSVEVPAAAFNTATALDEIALGNRISEILRKA